MHACIRSCTFIDSRAIICGTLKHRYANPSLLNELMSARENTFLYFMNEQRKTVWTESTAKGHITTLRSQSHRCPDRRKVSICMHSSRLPCKRNTKTYITACHYEENYSITESNENKFISPYPLYRRKPCLYIVNSRMRSVHVISFENTISPPISCCSGAHAGVRDG